MLESLTHIMKRSVKLGARAVVTQWELDGYVITNENLTL